MNDIPDIQGQAELQAWIKQQLEEAVKELLDKQVVSSMLVEAKPAWVFPFRILIGKIRHQGETSGFSWFICGDLTTEHADSSVAPTPREAARYFSLRWQLEAARREDGGNDLAETAEALYRLTEDERLWLQE